MNLIYNDPQVKTKRRNLRKNQTDAERLIWSKLRNNQIAGLKFFRQYSAGPYILDFYCPKIRLAIEIDGGQHAEEKKLHDEERTNYLKKNDIVVLRFWNNDVLQNIDGVVLKILESVKEIS